MNNPQQIEVKVEARHRVFLIVWVALLVSITMLLGFALAVPSSNATANPTLSLALLGVALMLVAGSFLIKHRTVQNAIAKRDVASLQSGYIVSYAVCEAAALFGLFDHFVTGSSYYYCAFIAAMLGMLLHFPKKDHIRDATA